MMEELEDDILALDTVTRLDDVTSETLAAFFEGYARMLNSYVEFRNLGDSLRLLANKIGEVDVSLDSSVAVELLKSIVADLLKWKEVILVEQTAKDIHYMDDSFFGNIAQVEILLAPPSNDGDSEIEFF